jgi:hypothetical protein
VVYVLAGRDTPKASGTDGAWSFSLGSLVPVRARIKAAILPISRVWYTLSEGGRDEAVTFGIVLAGRI